MRAVGDDESARRDALAGVARKIANRAIRVPDDPGELIERMTAHREAEQFHFITIPKLFHFGTQQIGGKTA